MRYKKDLTDFIKHNLESIVEEHFEIFKDRYYRKSKSDVIYDLKYNYDMSSELETVQNELNRDLTINEQSYYIDQFYKMASKIFYI